MKIASVSGDMVVKVALAGVVLLGVAYAIKKAKDGLGDAVDAVGNAVAPINPLSPENVAYQTGNNFYGGYVFTSPTAPGKNADGSWNTGAFIYDMTHKDPTTGKWWWQ